ncbi:hypothetical protein BCR15_13320 [Tessaracoccus lapidicaptus]|uniref:Uncharacterized protein n=1 Tax=Tessaracoccus lapidicaptus TaxID=1427523 RepID=A0A1C0AQX5_9ACTN|nr:MULTISPECIES: Lsr2 family protein [Tessaracoccus]AQX16349.1 Lsr2 family protein [Tessaracoccus sp. T2.5-30]OCL36788.1 hypothetical protein BCR15_13320 [Tessaracoccus lapidicaptus]VEP40969.1 Nucleoid-associated protein Lsr2 [Tessaracoccus lapidicaptus]
MARQVRVFLVDDIDGSPDARTIEFSLGRDSYTIDLTEKNAAKLESALAPFIEKATKAGRKAGAARKPASRKTDNNAVREWARENGRKVSDRGRIPADVIAAYEAAH